MAERSKLGSRAGISLVVALFVVSFGASAGATVLVGSEDTPAAAPAPTSTPTPSPTPTPSATPAATRQPSPSATPEPKPSPSVATKRQIKTATGMLCDADPAALPVLTTQKASPQWSRIFEVHLSKQDIDPGPIDGEYDLRAFRGAKELQRNLGLEQTGKVGETTWSALWTDQCYEPPVPVTTWQPSGGTSSGGGGTSSGGGGSGGGGGGGGTLDRVE